MNLRPMTDVEKRTAAKAFVETWLGRGDEKQDAQSFLEDVPDGDIIIYRKDKHKMTRDAYILPQGAFHQ